MCGANSLGLAQASRDDETPVPMLKNQVKETGMSKRLGWMLALMMAVALVYTNANAAEGGNGGRGGGMRTPPTVEQIEEKIGVKLTDEQKTKITAIHDEIVKKDAELEAKDEVKKLREDMKTAEGPARREIYTKIKDAKGGFDPMTEYKTKLAGILTEEQIGKAFPQRQRGGQGGDKPAGEKKGGDAAK